ncbi:MAG TPA: dienelactone hydrolase family protein [Longimicrobiales bacterium]|nr:dienelactone hydrolase family protein [Longimicrobiales bacterium]
MSEEDVRFTAADAQIDGSLGIPDGANGVVCFAHGSGSSRFSSRNRYIARVLRDAGLATLLIDLLTREEERVDATTAHLRFDIPLLARRVVAACDWLSSRENTAQLPIGTFGASTGAAAALLAAAERPDTVRAVVSRGGRPDLAEDALSLVRAPVLLIVGGLDHPVIEMNRSAAARLAAPHELVIVPGATHLFEEPGTMEQVGTLARDFLVRELTA